MHLKVFEFIFKGLFFYYLQVSAWLHNSIDPVEGNDKKSDQYWFDVTSTYNSTTKCGRMRNRNQLKLCWERIKKPVTEFNGCYARISKAAYWTILLIMWLLN